LRVTQALIDQGPPNASRIPVLATSDNANVTSIAVGRHPDVTNMPNASFPAPGSVPEDRPLVIDDGEHILRANPIVVDSPWSNPPGAPRWRNLTTPSDSSGPITVDSNPATVSSTNEGVPDAGPVVEDRPSATYPFADISRVPSPTPRGFYDPDDYHRLERHQIQSLLERRPDPARFDRYAFADQQFADFYQGVISDFANLSNNYPAANDRERDARVAHVVSVTRRFHSLNRVVRP